MPRVSDPIHCGRQDSSLRVAGADTLGSEVTPGASGLPGESCSSAKTQVSLQQVFLVFRSRVASYRYKLVLHFLQIEGGVIWFSLKQLLLMLNVKWEITVDNFNFLLDIYSM